MTDISLPATRREFDWEAIEADFRAAQMTHRAIAAKHGCSHGAIQQRAKKEGWTQDLSARVNSAVRAKLAKAPLAKSIANAGEIVEAAANRAVAIVEDHLDRAARIAAVADKLIVQSVNAKGVAIISPGDLARLASTAESVQRMQRQSLGIDEKPIEDPAQRFAQMPPQERLQAATELVRRIAVLVEVRG